MEFGHGPFWKDFLFMLVIGVTITIIRSIYQNSKRKHRNENKYSHGGTVRNRSVNKTVQIYIERLISTHEDRKKPKGPDGLTDKQKTLYYTIKAIVNENPSELLSNKQITKEYQLKHGSLELGWKK